MEEIVLILFVLGLMVLFFLLGAAIGGVARSLKAYLFGVKDHEKFCGQRKDTAIAASKEEGFDAAAAALAAGGVASGVALSNTEDKTDNTVQVTHDELETDASKEWTEEAAQETDPIDETVEVVRAAEEEISEQDDNEDLSVATPKEGEHSLETEELSEVQVSRDEAAETVVEDNIIAQEDVNEEDVTEEDHSSEDISDEQAALAALAASQAATEDLTQEETPQEENSQEETIQEDSTPAEESADESGVDLSDIAGAAAAAVAGVAAVAGSKEEEKEELGAPVWDYTQQEVDYSDVVFAVDGEDDDLQLIKGIDAEMEAELKQIGLRQYGQIAELSGKEVNFLRNKFNFYSTLNEQVWIEQAKVLSTGQLTVYAKSLSSEAP
ncbi:MAG: hypothetical protein ACRBBJ_09565, partial [Rhodomicrobiaceae bacterium]